MPTNLNGHYFHQIDFNLSNDSWIIGKNAFISSGNYGLSGVDTYDNIDITVKGRIWAYDTGIYSAGDNINAVIEAGGQLSANYGISLFGAHCSIKNAGEIVGYTGVYANGEDIKTSNTGIIHASFAGITMSFASDTFTNGKTGEVHAGTVGVYFTGGAIGEVTKTINHGLIAGDVYSFHSADFSSSANDKLINDGKMIGNIAMGLGNDTLDTRGGTIQGVIDLGEGNDRLYTDKASYKLLEGNGNGFDTVYSTVTYKLSDNVEGLFLLGKKDINGTGTTLGDMLHGNSGNNVLKGLDGMDELWGGKGNDKLFGGASDIFFDLFHFATGDGKDVIMDFDGPDRIEIGDWAAITDFNDLKNNHATNQGNDLLLHAGSDSILIKNFHKADLDPMDFQFADA